LNVSHYQQLLVTVLV